MAAGTRAETLPDVHATRPLPASADVYDDLYAEYVTLHDYFGRGASTALHRLRALRDRAGRDRAGQARVEGGRS